MYPALALAQELERRGHSRSSLRFVGATRGPEGGIVRDAGYDIDLLPGRGLQRRLTLENVAVLWQTAVAFVRAFRLVRRYRPAVVVGFGSYASLPCVLAARARRVPVVVHDQDAVPGLANRIAIRLGARAAVSLPGAHLAGAVLTGNPVRDEFQDLVRRPSAARPLVAVFGGALGAGSVNAAALGLYDRWRDRRDLAVHHVTGPRNYEDCAARLAALRAPADVLDYELAPYEAHMEELYARASLAVCRAGAGTIAELTAAGLPAVLVPLPGAPSDHQRRNAQTLADAGAARCLLDSDCTPARLSELVEELLADPSRLDEMGAAARALARPDAAARLADLVEAHAR